MALDVERGIIDISGSTLLRKCKSNDRSRELGKNAENGMLSRAMPVRVRGPMIK